MKKRTIREEMIQMLEEDIAIYEEQVRRATDPTSKGVYEMFIASKKKQLERWLARTDDQVKVSPGSIPVNGTSSNGTGK